MGHVNLLLTSVSYGCDGAIPTKCTIIQAVSFVDFTIQCDFSSVWLMSSCVRPAMLNQRAISWDWTTYKDPIMVIFTGVACVFCCDIANALHVIFASLLIM